MNISVNTLKIYINFHSVLTFLLIVHSNIIYLSKYLGSFLRNYTALKKIEFKSV